jgi:hypothetical protein
LKKVASPAAELGHELMLSRFDNRESTSGV